MHRKYGKSNWFTLPYIHPAAEVYWKRFQLFHNHRLVQMLDLNLRGESSRENNLIMRHGPAEPAEKGPRTIRDPDTFNNSETCLNVLCTVTIPLCASGIIPHSQTH